MTTDTGDDMNDYGDAGVMREASSIAQEYGHLRTATDCDLVADGIDKANRDTERDEALAQAMIAGAKEETGAGRWQSWEYLPAVNRRAHLAAARAARAHIAAEGGTTTDPESLSVEPPVGSVVRDRGGSEWRRYEDRWCVLSPDPRMRRWDFLRIDYGPLTLVSTPDESATSRAPETAGHDVDGAENPRSTEWVARPGAWATILPGADRGGVPEGVDRVLVMDEHESPGRHFVAWEGRLVNPYDSGSANTGGVLDSSLGPVRPRVWTDPDEVPSHVVVRDGDEYIADRTYMDGPVPAGFGPFTEVLEDKR